MSLTLVQCITDFLTNQPPLTVLTSGEVISHVFGQNLSVKEPSIRAELQRQTLGLKTAKLRKTENFYAIHASVNNQAVYLTLGQGIHINYFNRMSPKFIEEVKRWLCTTSLPNSGGKSYPEEVLDYWVCAGQYRSVEFVRGATKDQVKQRNQGQCQICAKLPKPSNSETLRISHIVSRQSLYWYAISIIHRQGFSLFSPNGVQLLEKLLKWEQDLPLSPATLPGFLHSSPEYLTYLCVPHDRVVQKVINYFHQQSNVFDQPNWFDLLLRYP